MGLKPWPKRADERRTAPVSRRLRQAIETLDRLAREVEQWSTVDAEGLSDREAFARVVPEASALSARSFALFDALLSGGTTKHSSIELLVAEKRAERR